jgi:hypothetical protein
MTYFSEALKGSSLTLSIYKKEILDIIKKKEEMTTISACETIHGSPNQKSLKYLLEQSITTPVQAH